MRRRLNQPTLKVIDKPEDIREVVSHLSDKDIVAYDSETTGLHKGAQVVGISICADDSIAYYIIIYGWEKDTQTIKDFGTLPACKELMLILQTKQLVMHNGTFDCEKAEDFFKINLIESLHTDTMILAHLLNENRRVGLKELAKEYFGESSTVEAEEMKASVLSNGGQYTAKSKEMYKADPYLLGKYGAKDAWLTYMLFLELLPELYEQGLDNFFYNEESMPLLRGPTYHLNTTGLRVDVQKLTELKKTLEAECAEAKAFIMSEIKPHIQIKYPGTNKKNQFNIGATQQLSWLLFGKIGYEFNTLTDAGKDVCRKMGLKLPYTPSAKRDFIHMCENNRAVVYEPEATINGKKSAAKKVKEPWAYIACDKKTLQKIAPRSKWVATLLEYQRKTKLLNTYVKGLEERIQYGIIHPSFLQHGTTSGRYSSRDPNFQNLPRDDKRIKSCIVARPGRLFVGADYSQLEPRVFAYYSKDERLLKAFEGEDDFYSTIGMEVYDKHDCIPRKEGPNAFGEKYKRLRDLSKVIALASTYGATAHQLAPTTGKSIDETQKDMDSYFRKFPGVANMMLEAHEIAKTKGQVVNLFGRPRRMPEALKIPKMYGKTKHADLPYEARNVLNLAVNHRIQSTGASIVNRSAIAFYNNAKQAGIECRLALQVHDSLVVECLEKDAESVALLLQDAMENTIDLKTIKLEAVPKIGTNLAEV